MVADYKNWMPKGMVAGFFAGFALFLVLFIVFGCTAVINAGVLKTVLGPWPYAWHRSGCFISTGLSPIRGRDSSPGR